MAMTPEERFEQKLGLIAENQAHFWSDIQEHSVQIRRNSDQIERSSSRIAIRLWARAGPKVN